jgi:hypothetical protein
MARSDRTVYDSQTRMSPEPHWSLRRTFGFVFCSSALLWTALAIGVAAAITAWQIGQMVRP